ncbi:PilC/PilY family type IV pilus protein [Ramlibacter sp. H39-3-26]|uniref:pilus assembly protein n=1 Tax=Curvibacter soli TaxID=3031331 RepID=UPI0023DBCFDE|nr:PilC/PilY family type IV pilus protein [Ramlibacter sp. H39-3-26]MDF1483651.1 PilC/PilY family type IV pilus protein [Ramlibacter sp. H39-3-26]
MKFPPNAVLRMVLAWSAACMQVFALATPVDVSTPQPAVPPNIVTNSNRPMMMLATSKDHTLFGPIYTDFEDIDGDGVIDTTFIPTFKYYGYFDATKCYSYSSSNNRFEPAAIATITGGRYTCSSSSSYWSGNFLNWGTMTRLDVIRKMLYGGKRSTDTSSSTILERTNLSKDSHSFVKFYNGTDIRDYTPFTTAALTKTTGNNPNAYAGISICNRSDQMGEGGNPVIRLAKGNYRLWATVEGTVCEWGAGDLGVKLARYFKDADKGNGGIAHEQSPPSDSTDGAKYGSIGPELTVRVQVCQASMLGEERCQAFPPDSTTNYKPFGLFQEFGFSNAANTAARTEFGVITGSYDKNLNAGALRKNMGDFLDEINPSTGVFCHSTSSGCAATLADGRATGNGAIKALDSYVLYGRGSGGYDGSNNQKPADMTDGTLPAWGNPVGEMVVQALQYYSGVTSTNPGSTTNDGNKGLPVVAWADPLSNANATRKNLYGNSICRPMYTLALSSSALSFDGQAGTPFETLPNRALGSLTNYVNKVGDEEVITNTSRSVGSATGGYGDACSAKAVASLDNVSGICPEAPAIGGTYQVAGAALYANTSKIRTTAQIGTPPTDLKFVQDALKVKTMAASLTGGVARVEVPIPGTNPKKYVYITPESVWDSAGKMTGAMLTFASIASGSDYGTFVVTWNDALFGGDYDMDIAGFLRYDVVANAESSTGYDIKITTDIINVGAGNKGTHGFSVMGTDHDGRYLTHRHQDGDGALAGVEGYLCGDGTYKAARVTEAANAGVSGNSAGTYNACLVNSAWNQVFDQNFPVSLQFHMLGAQNTLIQEPLWYAAKYGYFKSSTKNPDDTFTEVPLPTDPSMWDQQKSDGSPGADGIPDGYFLARRPDILEEQLRKALDSLARNSNAAPAVSSAALTMEGAKYVAKFDSTTVQGDIEAYSLDDYGFFKTTPDWKAGQKLRIAASGADGTGGDQGASRTIVTDWAGVGKDFIWAALPDDYKTRMASINSLTEANAQLAVNYIRGDQTKEGVNGLRIRGDSLLGPVVNATPWLQAAPSADYIGATFPGYATFVRNQQDRDSLLWVGANDGMVHAFNPDSGAEVFAYIPSALANRLVEIPLQRGTTGRTHVDGANFISSTSEAQPQGTVWPYVDGSPFAGDVQLGTGSSTETDAQAAARWRSYVFGTLGRGGKAVYALDATDTGALSKDSFKWQFTSDDNANLGYITGDVSSNTGSNQASPIVKLNNGRFAVIFGNGYKSTTGAASLFILYVDGPSSAGTWTQGTHYRELVATAGTASCTSNCNGLMTPTWVDVNGDGTADVIYAGDLKGNMWRFNVGSTDPAQWGVPYEFAGEKLPLYIARSTSTGSDQSVVTNALPITSAPEIVFRSTGGMMVVFGTGDAFDSSNFPRIGVTQRIYGIWDKPGYASDVTQLPQASDLVARTYTVQSDGTVIVTDGGAIDWAINKGWYFDLPRSSEMVLSNPVMKAGVLTFTTVRPKTEVDDCTNKPNAALYTIDPISGKPERVTQGVVTIGATKYITAARDIADQKVRVVRDKSGTRAFGDKCVKGTAGCECTTEDGNESCTKQATCRPDQQALAIIGQGSDGTICFKNSPRLQWREIPGIRTDL